jgi:hypothetical protein
LKLLIFCVLLAFMAPFNLTEVLPVTNQPMVSLEKRLRSMRQALQSICDDVDAQIHALELANSPPSAPALCAGTEQKKVQFFEISPNQDTGKLTPIQPVVTSSSLSLNGFEPLSSVLPQAHSALPQLLPSPMQSAPISPMNGVPMHKIIEAPIPAAMEPDLEMATLEELNTALARAFAEITTRPAAGANDNHSAAQAA